MASKATYASAAKTHGLMIAEYDGNVMGIGERDELQALIDDGTLPSETLIREALAGDF